MVSLFSSSRSVDSRFAFLFSAVGKYLELCVLERPVQVDLVFSFFRHFLAATLPLTSFFFETKIIFSERMKWAPFVLLAMNGEACIYTCMCKAANEWSSDSQQPRLQASTLISIPKSDREHQHIGPQSGRFRI